MSRLSIDDLATIKDNIKGILDINKSDYDAKITVHMGTCGIAAGAEPVMQALREETGSKDNILLTSSGCPGLCSQEPMVTVELKGREPVKYIFVDSEKAKRIFKEHVLKGHIVEKYALAQGRENEA